MKHFIIRYLTNRREFYSLLLERIPSARFTEALKTATYPFEESDAEATEIDALADAPLRQMIPQALLLDDLLKKNGVGLQAARTVISVREALSNSERIETIGYVLFEALSKQDLTSSTIFADLAQNRQRCLLNILQLRDDLDYHRLRLL